jgi:hypothetical protein
MKKFLQIFFGVSSVEEMRKRGLSMALIIPAIRWGEWALLGATGALVTVLKSVSFWGFQVTDIGIFLILWIGNMAIEASMVWFNDKVDVDVTLMEGLRRLVDNAFLKSKIAGLIIETIVVIRLVVWDGSGYFIIFFRDRLSKKATQLVLFVLASGFQMAIWTALYVAGYEGFLELFGKLF